MDGEKGTVTRLLSEPGAQSFINYQNAGGLNPLSTVASFGHEAIVKQLIAARCNVDIRLGDGCLVPQSRGGTPLYAATLMSCCPSQSRPGHLAVVKALIACRCDINLPTVDGITPLYLAAANGHASITEQLIAARCDLNLQESSSLQHDVTSTIKTKEDGPLDAAAKKGHVSIAKQLILRCNVDLRNFCGRTALQSAQIHGHSEIARLIQSRKQEKPLLGRRVLIKGIVAKPELNGRTGTAVSFDDDKGRYLVELDETSSALMIQPCNLSPVVCSLALCRLFRYIYQGSHDLFILRQAIPELTKEQQVAMTGTQLLDAARDGDTATVRTLLSASGAQSLINYQDAQCGSTALLYAAYKGLASVTEHLLAARCKVLYLVCAVC
jgi:hypothetical protein